ncbi:MAG: TetR/AcrR family transcriptional regulator [Desulfovibrio sp.]
MHTKDLILKTAKEMIAEVGYHKTTTAKLARKAGISEGTIYRHFSSKEEILLQILQELGDSYTEYIQSLYKESEKIDYITLERMLDWHMTFVDKYESDVRIVLNTYGILESSRIAMAKFTIHMRNFFEDMLRSSIERGHCAPVPVRQTAMVFVMLIMGTARAKLYATEFEEFGELNDFSEEMVKFTRRGIVPWDKLED